MADPNRKEPKQISFRVSEKEYKRLKEMADNLSMTVPTFCKKKSQKSKIKSPKIDVKGAREIAHELRKIGVNVNQIAKHLNSGGTPLENDLEAVRKEIKKIWQLLS